jgi:hypothetical protein
MCTFAINQLHPKTAPFCRPLSLILPMDKILHFFYVISIILLEQHNTIHIVIKNNHINFFTQQE